MSARAAALSDETGVAMSISVVLCEETTPQEVRFDLGEIEVIRRFATGLGVADPVNLPSGLV
eukprot:261506-Rhodomonas_salina.1